MREVNSPGFTRSSAFSNVFIRASRSSIKLNTSASGIIGSTGEPYSYYADLNEKVSRVRGSRERFIRQCISGAAIREAPSVDVPKLIYEVRRVGASLNRILIIANARGLLEVSELRRALERNRELEVRIVDTYTKD